jgi:hypothetical protein
MYSIVEGRDFALKGGKPGFRTSDGQWIEIDTKTFDKKELDRLTADYQRRRGPTQIQKDIEAHNKAKSQQAPAKQPPAKPPADPGAKQPGESLTDYAKRTEREASASQPPASQPPASQPPASQPPASGKPPASTSAAPPPKVSPSKPAQTGDRTKDLTTWTTTPRNRNMINTSGTPQQKAILSAADKGTTMPAPRPISKDIEDIKKMQTASRARQGVKESYDAYDLVLEYLLSQGHVETVEEANYVMLVMDAETIGSIVEGVMPEPIDPTAHNKSQRFATQQGKIRSLESGAATSGEKSAAQSKLKGPQLPGV